MPVRRKLHDWETLTYATQAEAHRLAQTQSDAYHRLADDHPGLFQLVEDQVDLREVLAGWAGDPPPAPRVGLVLLIEGADCVRSRTSCKIGSPPACASSARRGAGRATAAGRANPAR